MEKKLSKSVRKFIRSEKSRIRGQFLDFKKQEELITELYKKVLGRTEAENVKEIKQDTIKLKSKTKQSKVRNKVKS